MKSNLILSPTENPTIKEIFEIISKNINFEAYSDAEIKRGKPYEHFFELVTRKEFSPKETGLSYRTLNHWCESGLIEDSTDRDNKWRKFSFKDLVWIKIATELRTYGFPIKSLQEARKWFDSMILNYCHKEPNKYLDQYLYLAFTDTPVNIIFQSPGYCHFVYGAEARNLERFYNVQSYLSVNLNFIVGWILGYPGWIRLDPTKSLTVDEQQILDLISEKAYKEISIRFADGKAVHFEGTEIIDNEGRITELLSSEDFQHINLKQTDGQIVEFTRTVQRKLN